MIKTRLLTRFSLLTACLVLLLASVSAQDQQVPRPTMQWLDSLARVKARPQPGRPPGLSPGEPRVQTNIGHSAPAGMHPFSVNACSDTSARFALEKAPGNFYVGNALRSRDGNILMSGEYVVFVNSQWQSQGFLMKTDTTGKVIFTKLYDSLNHQNWTFLTFYDLLELQDGSIMLAGSSPEPVSENWDFILSKTDAAGNLLWTTDLYSRLWVAGGGGSGDYFYVQQMAQDPAGGDVYITGPSWAEGFYLLKVDSKTGNINWSTTYKLNANGYNNEVPGGLVVRQNDVVVFGSFFVTQAYLLAYRVNKQNGDTLGTLAYSLDSGPGDKLGFLKPQHPQILNDGGIAFPGVMFGVYDYFRDSLTPFYQAGVLRLNANLEVRDGFVFRNLVQSNIGNSMVTVHADGTGIFTMMQSPGGYHGEWVQVQFRDKRVVKERRRAFTNEGYPFENNAIQLAASREMLVQSLGDSIKNTTYIAFSKLSATDTGSVCLGRESFETFTEPISYSHSGSAWLEPVRYDIFRVRRPRSLNATSLAMDPPFDFCRQASTCNNFRLSVNRDTACPFVPLLLTARRDATCGSRIHWQYDSSGVKSFRALNDSVYEMVFSQGWEGKVQATLEGCEVLMDSVRLVVLDAPAFPDLGPDTVICAGNTILLNARKGFASYRWQDGSRDSVFTVTKPGIYFVKVTSACGVALRDTVVVSPHPPVAFSLGGDQSICLGDSTVISATGGFLSYSWSPNYRITSLAGATNTVKPLKDTQYFVRAESSPGCFAYDTIGIRVKQFPAIHLGNDTSFCAGDSIVLDAGSGFAQWQWNNGAYGRFLTAKTPGAYIVTGTTADACHAADTLRILQVFPNPQVNLGNDPVICSGSQRVLDAGPFSTFAWSTGEASRQVVVVDTGFYSVKVSDANHCMGTGSLHIATLIMPPAHFLPQDTAICNYGELVLTTISGYSSYLWSTGQSAQSITITNAGLYWLQVTDAFKCRGTDSINISTKECLKGLFVPTAFTPNQDGKNDKFKPLIYGNVLHFTWTVYNRFGQAVFSSANPVDGWNGTFKGVLQEQGNYVWKCNYQLAGEEPKLKSGTVMLMR